MIDPRPRPRQGDAPQPVAPLRVTLSRFHEDWWDLYAVPNLSPKTLELYRYLWRALLQRGLCDRPLEAITTVEIERWKLDLMQRGVGSETIKRTLTMLQGVFARALEWGTSRRIPSHGYGNRGQLVADWFGRSLR